MIDYPLLLLLDIEKQLEFHKKNCVRTLQAQAFQSQNDDKNGNLGSKFNRLLTLFKQIG